MQDFQRSGPKAKSGIVLAFAALSMIMYLGCEPESVDLDETPSPSPVATQTSTPAPTPIVLPKLEDDVEGGCRDRIDNDGDGLLDCNDPDCEPTRGSCSGSCGNGKIDPGLGEFCDDGNTVDGDGCSSTCQTE